MTIPADIMRVINEMPEEYRAGARRFMEAKLNPPPVSAPSHRCMRSDRVCWWPSNHLCMEAP